MVVKSLLTGLKGVRGDKFERGLPRVTEAVVSRLAEVMKRACSGRDTRGLCPFELRLLKIEPNPLVELCDSGVRGDFGSL